MVIEPISIVERLRFHANRVEECGHLNAARYMRLAADELESKPSPDQAIESPMTTVNELVLSIVKMTPAERFNLAFKVAESIGYRLIPIGQSPIST